MGLGLIKRLQAANYLLASLLVVAILTMMGGEFLKDKSIGKGVDDG